MWEEDVTFLQGIGSFVDRLYSRIPIANEGIFNFRRMYCLLIILLSIVNKTSMKHNYFALVSAIFMIWINHWCSVKYMISILLYQQSPKLLINYSTQLTAFPFKITLHMHHVIGYSTNYAVCTIWNIYAAYIVILQETSPEYQK